MLPSLLPKSRHGQLLQKLLQQDLFFENRGLVTNLWTGGSRYHSSESHGQGQGAAASAAEEKPMDLEQLRDIPGYLKGPLGRRVVRAVGEEEWRPASDPKTGEACWRSIKTGEYTVPGIEKPDTWTQVADKKTGLLYYWNMRTGETTDIGEPKPGPYGRVKTSHGQSDTNSVLQHQQRQGGGLFSALFGSSQSRRGGPAKSRKDDGRKDFTVADGLRDLLTRPSGWAFIGFSLLALVYPYLQAWLSGSSA